MKRTKEVIIDEKALLDAMPSATKYEKSYNHKDLISHILVSHRYDFIFTVSIDGFLRFWKKAETGIEFVKTFRAHTSKISGVSLSQDE